MGHSVNFGGGFQSKFLVCFPPHSAGGETEAGSCREPGRAGRNVWCEIFFFPCFTGNSKSPFELFTESGMDLGEGPATENAGRH